MGSEPSEYPRKRRASGQLRVIYLLGALSGVALTLLAIELYERQSPDMQLYREVRQLVQDHFVDETDPDQLVDDALSGMVAGLDPYSRYYPADELGRLNRETLGTFVGIGVVFKPPSSEFRVLYPTPGSPSIGKIGVGDRLVSLNGEQLSEMKAGELQERVRASNGMELAFEIEARSGELREELLTPTRVLDPTVRHASIIDDELGVAYCAVIAFSQETLSEFDRAIAQLTERGMRALIIDLRDNPGGILVSAVAIANRFVSSGTLVSTRSRNDSRAFLAKPELATLSGLPLVLLVDGGSASASEVLAGAIQDHRVGALVGSPTYGKGMVQTLQPYGDRAVLKLTTSVYTTPANRQIDRNYSTECGVGIDPDLLISISEADTATIHNRLAQFSPPYELSPEIERWEREEGLSLLAPWPVDAQREAALRLFRGEIGASAE